MTISLRLSIARRALALVLGAAIYAALPPALSLSVAAAHESDHEGHGGKKRAAVTTTLSGVVSVVRSGDQVSAISLAVPQGKKTVVFAVTLDNMGRQLAAYAGKTVSVTGTLHGATLTVTKIG